MSQSKLSELPRQPSRGNRRKLEAAWLDELEKFGLPDGLLEVPAGPPPQLIEAIELFNRGLYWECHETLEEVWLETLYPLRFFYHAIIKAAVGFHHLGRHNRHGARVKLGDAVRLLPFFQPQFMGIHTDALLRDTAAWLERLEKAERLDWESLDALPRPIIIIVGRFTTESAENAEID
jgi:predicted metal-dependent hydrolase